MANLGSFGGATLQKSKQINTQKTKSWEPATVEGGGDGGNGKKIFNGGGGGDEGDDDDYFNDKEGGDNNDDNKNFFRALIPMLYDPTALKAVLEEWYMNIADLPSHIRKAVDMTLYSSAHLYRLFSLETRPSVARNIARSMPQQMQQGVVGRVMADPAFLHKLFFEGSLVFSTSLFYEHHIRQKRFLKEFDLSLINSLTATATTLATVYFLAPTRSLNISATHRFPFQRMVETLPNNIFERSAPMKNYKLGNRVMGLLSKVGQLSLIGGIGGAAQVGLSKAAKQIRLSQNPKFKYYVKEPELARAVVGGALFSGIHANLRYQAVGGVDRFMFDHFNFMWAYITSSLVTRFGMNWIGHVNRPMALGMPLKAPPIKKRRRVTQKIVKTTETGQEEIQNLGQETQQVIQAATPPALAT